MTFLDRIFTRILMVVLASVIVAGAGSALGTARNLSQEPLLELTPTEKTWLQAHPSISVAFDGYFPPYSFLNEQGEMEGLAVDMFQILALRAGIHIQVSPKTLWKDLYEAAQNRQVDVVATMGRQPEREEWFFFTQPYIFKSLVIMTRTDTKGITQPQDLAGKKVALVEQYQYVRSLLEDHPLIRPYYVETMLDGLNAVSMGQADAAITFIGAGHYLKTKYQIPNLKFAAIFDRDRFTESIAVRKDWPELVSILDKALASITDDEKKALGQRWVGPKEIPGIPLTTVFLYLGIMLGVGLALTAGFLIWNRALQNQVGRRTRELNQELIERQRAEKALGESQERFKDIFNAANDGVFIHNLETGAILDVNQKMCQMFGLTRKQALASDVGSLSAGVPPYTQEDAMAWINKAVAGQPQLFEWQAKHQDGHLFWLEVNMGRAAIGPTERIIVSARDITQRKAVEAELQKVSQERQKTHQELVAISRIITACASTMDVEEIFNKVLEEALEITGLEGGTLCSVTPKETLDIMAHRETSEATLQDLTTHAVQVGDCLCGECARDHKPLILADREAVLKFSTREAARGEDIRFHAAFPLVAGKRCLGVLCVFTRTDAKPSQRSLDLLETISAQIALAIDNAQLYRETLHQATTLEHKVLERTADLDKARGALLNLVDDLNAANERLKELDRLKSMFIASMSHELRTPLNSIIGFSGIILGDMVGPITDEQRDMLGRVSRAGKHLLALITDVIDIAKIESGKVVPYPKEFELTVLVREAMNQVEAQALEKGLALKIQVPAEPIIMHTDQRRLLQCMFNYLSNAMKFSEKGGVTIAVVRTGREAQGRVNIQGREKDRDWVEISVTDTGIGIKQEDMDRLFGSFVRFETQLKTIIPGTGLGLYLTRKLATEVLGGQVGAESELGIGSRFWIRIPRVLDPAE